MYSKETKKSIKEIGESKMNILVISTVRYRSNGISNVIRNLFRDESFHNEKLFFLFPADNDSAMIKELEEYGYTVYSFPRYEKGGIAYLNYVREIVSKDAIEIVHIHGNSHALILELLGSVLGGCKVRICHSHNTTCNNLFMHKVLAPFFYMLCTGRFACGQEAGKWMFGKKAFKVINNGIRTERFLYSEEDGKRIRERYHIDEQEFVIGHVGNLNVQKNQTVLLDIMAELVKRCSCRCMLVGEGEKRISLEEKAKQLGISENVIFCGATNEVPGHLSAINMIVMPSLYEGLPLSLIEEQASGLPCIVADTITSEVDKTGLVQFCPLDNIQTWVDTILYQKERMKNRREMSAKAIQKIIDCNYDVQHEISELFESYQSMLIKR